MAPFPNDSLGHVINAFGFEDGARDRIVTWQGTGMSLCPSFLNFLAEQFLMIMLSEPNQV